MTTKAKKKVRPIQPRHIPPCIREALAMHEALRRLGFPAEEIYCSYHPYNIQVVLQSQGKQFVIDCGAPGMRGDEFGELWTRACHLWNGTAPGMTGTTREIIYHESEILKREGGSTLVALLLCKGFVLPGLPPSLSDEAAKQLLKSLGNFNAPGGGKA